MILKMAPAIATYFNPHEASWHHEQESTQDRADFHSPINGD